MKNSQPLAEDSAKDSDHYGFLIYLCIALFAALCLGLYYWAKSKAFAFVDVGSDTFFCFYPLQVAVERQLHELHTFTWSFELGLGGFIGTLFDPLWLVTGWLPESWQLPLRLPMFLLRLLLGGGFFYGFLRQIGFRAPIAVIGGLGYAFSSYGLINGQWEVMHGTEFVQLAAYLFLLERYLQRGRVWAGIAAGIVVGLGHPLGLYMFALLSAIYAVIRLAAGTQGARLSLLRSFVTFALWCVLGLLITAPLLFPAIYYLLENPRVSGEHSGLHALFGMILTLNDRSIVATEIAGLLGKDLLGTGTNYQGWGNYFEAPGFYIGLLPLLCIPQLLGPHATRRERLLCVFSIACVALYIVWPAMRYAVYGFGHTAFRFSTLWISILLLVLGLTGLRRALVSGWWLAGVALAVAVVFTIAFGATFSLPAKVNIAHVIRVAAFTLLYAALACVTARAKNIPPAAVLYVLLPIAACEALIFAIPPVVERVPINADGSSDFGRYDDGTLKALDFIHRYDSSGDFYRIEKTFDSVFLDDPLMQDYAGTKSYYFNAASITRFVDSMNLPRITPSPNYISGMAHRHDVLNLVGVKYVLTTNRSLDTEPGMAYIDTIAGIDIYENTAAHDFAWFYPSLDDEAKANAVSPQLQRDAFVLDNVIVSGAAPMRAQLAALAQSHPEQDAVNTAAHIRKLREDHLEGSVQTPKTQVLLFSLPFDRGWTAQIDGANLDLFRADYGLTAALIPAGSHALQLRYAPPGRAAGWWCAMAAALLSFAKLLLRRSKAVTATIEPAVTQ